jgi:hypothetical protein
MFIQLPGPEGQPAWFNTDFVVSVYPAGHDAAKTVVTFQDGKSITIDRDCHKVMRQIMVTERPQFPLPLPTRTRPADRPHPSPADGTAAVKRRF